MVYHLLNLQKREEMRIKVGVSATDASVPTASGIWPNANWYERETWDMYGVEFSGHPNLRRILLPPTWEGHALRKDHPARATEMEPFSLDEERQAAEQEALLFKPEEWGMARATEDTEFMFLNLGPNHPSVHGVFRIALQLDGEVIIDAVPDSLKHSIAVGIGLLIAFDVPLEHAKAPLGRRLENGGSDWAALGVDTSRASDVQ